jgi:hypothetical protein
VPHISTGWIFEGGSPSHKDVELDVERGYSTWVTDIYPGNFGIGFILRTTPGDDGNKKY